MASHRIKSLEAEYRRQLESECYKAGLSTTGSLAVLQRSLIDYEEEQELVRLCQEEPGEELSACRKRKELEENVAECSSRDLRQAAKRGDLDAVRAAIRYGTDVNSVCDRHHNSALIKACKRTDDPLLALTIVKELLRHGASVRQPSITSQMPLHWACLLSSTSAVTVLLDANAPVHWADSFKDSALHKACRRTDDEAVHIVRLLLDRKAQLEPTDGALETPLLMAARFGRPEVVELLLQRGAWKHAAHEQDGENALISAARNKLYGKDNITILLAHNVPTVTRNDGDDAMRVACEESNVSVMRALKKHASGASWASLNDWSPSWNEDYGDILGLFDEAAEFGYKPDIGDFGGSQYIGPALPWGILRRCLPNIPRVFSIMQQCSNLRTWHWTAVELSTARHPVDGTTLLHVAAATNHLEAVRILMRLWANPFIRDVNGIFPLGKATDTQVREELLAYGKQPVRREVARWYGPCFVDRARAWMLCVLHWRENGVRFIPKDVALMIVHRVMALESV